MSVFKPLPEDQPSLLVIESPAPITPDEIIRPRKRSRERGAIGKHHRWLQTRIQEHGVDLVDVLIREALLGNILAIKIALERGWGVAPKASVQVNLPPTSNPRELQEAMHQLLARVAAGEIDTQTGQDLILMMRHILACQETITPQAGSTNGVSMREQLAERLQRVIEHRRANENGTGGGTNNSVEETAGETGNKAASDLITTLLERMDDPDAEMTDEEYDRLKRVDDDDF